VCALFLALVFLFFFARLFSFVPNHLFEFIYLNSSSSLFFFLLPQAMTVADFTPPVIAALEDNLSQNLGFADATSTATDGATEDAGGDPAHSRQGQGGKGSVKVLELWPGSVVCLVGLTLASLRSSGSSFASSSSTSSSALDFFHNCVAPLSEKGTLVDSER
jgi:hypothetical protein